MLPVWVLLRICETVKNFSQFEACSYTYTVFLPSFGKHEWGQLSFASPYLHIFTYRYVKYHLIFDGYVVFYLYN